MKMGGGFSLDISKAVKPNSSEDNHKDPSNEIDFKQSRGPIPSLKIGVVTEQYSD